MPAGFGPRELAILAGVVLLSFANHLPEVMRALGRSLSEFKNGLGGGGPWAGA